ncbi:UNVERIFIED_CONTAM: hypothetical protein FKN15_053882 [Acipenser sinensis]
MSCSARRAVDTVPQTVDGNWKGLQPAPAERPSLPGVLAYTQLSDRAAAVDVGDPLQGTSQDLSNMVSGHGRGPGTAPPMREASGGDPQERCLLFLSESQACVPNPLYSPSFINAQAVEIAAKALIAFRGLLQQYLLISLLRG